MKKSVKNISIKLTLSIFLIMFIFNGCMMMGMMASKTKIKPKISNFPFKVQTVNKTSVIDQMIDEVVLDLSKQETNIKSLAVWRIRSQTAGLNVEMIRQKLLTQLVNLNRYKVVTRQRLSELLEEQSLSLSGAIDETSAVEIGKLIGVEGFIDGYAAIENNRLMLNVSLIESESGVIIWAKTLERELDTDMRY